MKTWGSTGRFCARAVEAAPRVRVVVATPKPNSRRFILKLLVRSGARPIACAPKDRTPSCYRRSGQTKSAGPSDRRFCGDYVAAQEAGLGAYFLMKPPN